MRDFTRFDGAAEYVARRITESGRDAHDLTPESVALAILALKAEGFEEQRLVAPRQLLRRWQNHSTGAVLVDPKEAATYWPTGWAVLAWSGAQGFEKDCHDAAKFLLYVSGTTWQPRLDDPVGHDTTLHGWPWIGGSHSWVQPTAVNLMALAAAGRRDDVRVSQAVALLLNRQLPAGGWNYGNTGIFRNITRPLPEDTGYALTALRLHADRGQAEASLSYLAATATAMRAPAALAWAILGLASWNSRPERANDWLDESLALQVKIGPYPLRYIAQLLLARRAKSGLAGIFTEKM
ncbi:hypothetical protein [Singulisphaera acidiphila]|uniref:Squalene cyclase C-terminal domain-containing protein n=1 Tax=Singulisphaera acidiphila (strain ATCC BAA-1392 / DSM 18658 / VKM B-2454 / MOB10) TaxID=886293 RepID=L0DLS9_SINAD|nr:hypothetical protein [Singulisphaera acidiphila]AGA29775.1 hypothetical protein Sinac_5643 [Singulisphaera acidiphila DSM 18658]